MSNSLYRADIDGLRAIAVISVLLFHFGVNRFSGGFVGVDVFFVISGFLITRLIKNELESNRFSLINFYLRRARRLFPAMFVSLLLSFVLAYFLFSAIHFERFAGALLHAILSISNIYFWNEQGYFDTEAVFKPLLHTWSLSVEEQFYFIWPSLLLLLLTPKKQGFAVSTIAVLGLISLYFANVYMENDANAVFFLTPFRIIEFSIGAISVWLVQIQRKNAIAEEIILLSGLALIAYSILSFNNLTQFPGTYALIPCIGTAMAIYAGRARYSGKLLSNPLAVNIGLMSYSIYLIHWPLYVFYQYPVPHELETPEIIGLSATTLLLAALMYHLVETPFRRSKKTHQPSNRGYAIGCIVLAASTSTLAAQVWTHNGWPWRFQYPENPLNLSAYDYEAEKSKRYIHIKANPDCRSKIAKHCTSAQTIDGLVIGNSHAVDGYNALTAASQGAHRLSLVSLEACDAVADAANHFPPRWPKRTQCIEINKRWFNPKLYEGYDYLAISTLFSEFFLANELQKYLQFIKTKTQIKHVIVFGNYIRLTQELHSIVLNNDSLQENVTKYKMSAFLENEKIEKICKNMDCLFIDKKKLLCRDEDLSTCRLELKGIPFTWDKHHLSFEFSTLLGELASEQIESYLSDLSTI